MKKITTRDTVVPDKSQTGGKGAYSDHLTIPGSSDMSFLATLATGLLPVSGESHFIP